MSEALPGMPPPPAAGPGAPGLLGHPLARRPGGARGLSGPARRRTQRFAPGFNAFPGGRATRRTPRTGGGARGASDPADVACAARELFEEAGVLLARGAERLPPGGAGRGPPRPARRAGLLRRPALPGGAGGRRRRCFAPAGRWVTPEAFYRSASTPSSTWRGSPPGRRPEVWPGELSGGEFVPVAARARLLATGRRALPAAQPVAGITRAGARPRRPTLEALRHPPDDLRIEFQRGVVLCGAAHPDPAPGHPHQLLDARPRPGGGVAVVDPGSPEPTEQARLDRVLGLLAAEGRPAREVWLTHDHVDHVGGVAPLVARGLPVRAHPEIGPAPSGRRFVPAGRRWRAAPRPLAGPVHSGSCPRPRLLPRRAHRRAGGRRHGLHPLHRGHRPAGGGHGGSTCRRWSGCGGFRPGPSTRPTALRRPRRPPSSTSTWPIARCARRRSRRRSPRAGASPR